MLKRAVRIISHNNSVQVLKVKVKLVLCLMKLHATPTFK